MAVIAGERHSMGEIEESGSSLTWEGGVGEDP